MRGSTAAVLASRSRQRREARIRENYDRIFASLVSTDSSKFAARHPTRVIPEVPGILPLSKAEVKIDTREIEIEDGLSHQPDFQDEEELAKRVSTSYRPPVPPESTLLKKQQRFKDCLKENIKGDNNTPSLITGEINKLKEELTLSKNHLRSLQEDYEDYLERHERQRDRLTSLLSLFQTKTTALQRETRETLASLLPLLTPGEEETEGRNEKRRERRVPRVKKEKRGGAVEGEGEEEKLTEEELEGEEGEEEEELGVDLREAVDFEGLLREVHRRDVLARKKFEERQAAAIAEFTAPAPTSSGKSRGKNNASSSATTSSTSLPVFSYNLEELENRYPQERETLQIIRRTLEKKAEGKTDKELEEEREREAEERILQHARRLEKEHQELLRDIDNVGDLDFFLPYFNQENGNSGGGGGAGGDDPPTINILEAAIQSNPRMLELMSSLEEKMKAEESKKEVLRVNRFLPEKRKPFVALFDFLLNSENNDDNELLTPKEKEKVLADHLLHLVSTMDNNNNSNNPALNNAESAALTTRKKRRTTATGVAGSGGNGTPATTNVPENLIQMRTFARKLTEREKLLIFSPLSTLEDRYMGVCEGQNTIFTPWYSAQETILDYRDDLKNSQIAAETGIFPSNRPREYPDQVRENVPTYQYQSLVPGEIIQEENHLMEMNNTLAEMAIAEFNIAKLEAGIEELEKLVQEGQVSLQKTQAIYNQLVTDDYNERLRMKGYLNSLGLLPTAMSGEMLAQLDQLASLPPPPPLPPVHTASDQAAAASLLDLPLSQGDGKGGKAKRGGYPRGGKASSNSLTLSALASAAAAATAADAALMMTGDLMETSSNTSSTTHPRRTSNGRFGSATTATTNTTNSSSSSAAAASNNPTPPTVPAPAASTTGGKRKLATTGFEKDKSEKVSLPLSQASDSSANPPATTAAASQTNKKRRY